MASKNVDYPRTHSLGIVVESQEEGLFLDWCRELLKENIILSVKRESVYVLFSGIYREYTKPMKRVSNKIGIETILKPRQYTPDFCIIWNIENKFTNLFATDILSDKKKNTVMYHKNGISRIEIKGTFSKYEEATLANIKFIYETHKLLIQLIRVPKILKDTFCPQSYFFTKTGQRRKISWKTSTLQEFLQK